MRSLTTFDVDITILFVVSLFHNTETLVSNVKLKFAPTHDNEEEWLLD